jgi:hypothetical protein
MLTCVVLFLSKTCYCFSGSDSAGVVVAEWAEDSSSDAGANVFSGTVSSEKGIYPRHSKRLAAHPDDTGLFQESEKITHNLGVSNLLHCCGTEPLEP